MLSHSASSEIEARVDFPRHAEPAARRGRGVLLVFRQPIEQLALERLGLLRALFLVEIGAVEIRLERGGNFSVVAAMNFPRQPPGELLGVGLAADGRADGGVEEIGQVDLRFLEQIAEL